MTAFRFYLDESGRVVGGRCMSYDLSSETWSLAHLPVIPIPDEDIAWPNGERWEHAHYVGHIDAPVVATATHSGQLPLNVGTPAHVPTSDEQKERAA